MGVVVVVFGDAFGDVGGLVTVGVGSSVVSKYSAWKPRAGENEE